MKILFFLKYGREQASSRIRGYNVAERLRIKGLQCEITHGIGKYFAFPLKFRNYDIIYFQKCYSKLDIQFNRLAKKTGIKTVFDIDDSPGGVKMSIRTRKNTERMMRISFAVVTGSRRLEDFARGFNLSVYRVPSTIDFSYYIPKKRTGDGCVTLGWIGNGMNYKKDLRMLIGPLRNLGKIYKIKLAIVGAFGQREIYRDFGTIKNVKTEIIDSLDWNNPAASPSAISEFDIGLYPMIDNEYNRYKCGFKALEYMAMEIPAVVSPVGETKSIIDNNVNGFLVSGEKEWEEKLSYLISDEKRRRQMGKKGREKIEKEYSLDTAIGKIIKIFKEITE